MVGSGGAALSRYYLEGMLTNVVEVVNGFTWYGK